MIRLLLEGAAAGAQAVRGAAHHYLVHVHRVRKDDALEVFDGRGRSFRARVVSASEEAVELLLGEPVAAPRVRPVTVVQGMPKADKLELVVQKASELWATALVPAFCERSVVKPSDGDARKLVRWRKIAEEAARQSGRSEVLRVEAPVQLAAAVGSGALVLDEAEDARTLSAAVRALGAEDAVVLVVGPEGGFSDAERSMLHARGAQSVTLGRLVLRTETAALAALAVVRHLDGLLG
jgi:16S rRNA (uracil1498-N3)-methyltransferase